MIFWNQWMTMVLTPRLLGAVGWWGLYNSGVAADGGNGMGAVMSLSNYEVTFYAIPVFFTGLVILWLGIFSVVKNRYNVGSKSFFLTSISMALWLVSYSLAYMSKTEAVALFWAKLGWAGAMYIGTNVDLFTHSVLGGIKEKRTQLVVYYVISTLLLLFIPTTTLSVSGVYHYFWGYYPKVGPVGILFIAFFYLQMIGSFYAYYKRYRLEKVVEVKKQVGIVALSFLIAYTATVDYFPVLGIEVYPSGYISMFLFACGLYYAMAKYQLFDVQTVLHKTLLWSVTSAGLCLPVLWLLFHYQAVLSELPPWKYIGLVVAVFVWLFVYVRVIQPRIDHLFQRKKYALQAIVDEFISSLKILTTPEALAERLATVVRETLYASKVSIVYQETNEIIDAELSIPLVHHQERIAVMHLWKKVNLKPYTKMDLELLSKLAAHAAIAFGNALMCNTLEHKVNERTQALQQSNQKLQALDQAKTHFFSNVSEELRVSLEALIHMVQLVVESKDVGSDQQRQLLFNSQRSLMTMLNQVNELLMKVRLDKI